VNGTTREAYQPRVVVEVTQATLGRAPFIDAALKVLAER